MKNLFLSGIAFIRENPRIIYSFVLLVFVPAAFFFNTYSIISGMEKDIDRITQRKAALTEKIINVIASEKMDDEALLQKSIESITQNNEDILSVAILKPENNASQFRVIASSESEAMNQVTEHIQYMLAWNKDEGIAFLDSDAGGRFWRVTRALQDDKGIKIGLVTTAFSLRDSDALIENTVNHSYLILIVTVIIVLLLVSNQARLFGYVLTLNKLKEVDVMKDNLVSMASHELRTPLTAIKGYLELLEEKKLDIDEDAKRYFANISASVNRLNVLVNDMLEVSRIEGNRVPLTLTDFDPSVIINQSVEELRSQAVQKGLELKVLDIAEGSIRSDADRLREIMINLIGNAIKYTLKGSVSINAEIKDDRYLITVADTGFGISAEDQKKLFQKFMRIQTQQNKDIVGTGLGLWITFELAQKMGGMITVESIEGVGSHFTVSLPIAKKSQ
jgi:signal transduction histidine kinase